MWMFLTTLVVCATLIYLARTVGPPKLEILIAPKVPPHEAPADALPQPPVELMMFCAAESEAHAREVMLARAHKLYQQHGDWEKVLTILQRQEAE